MIAIKPLCHLRRQRAVELIQQSHFLVRRHVYVTSVFNDDYTTQEFICVDGMRLFAVTDKYGNPPKGFTEYTSIPRSAVCDTLEHLRNRYYVSHRHQLHEEL